MKFNKSVSFISILLALAFFTGCKKDVNVIGQTSPVSRTFSSPEAQSFLTNYTFDYEEQAVQDIKTSADKDIQNLKNYKTIYNVKRHDLADAMAAFKAIVDPPVENKDKEAVIGDTPFKVLSWGPQGEIPANMNKPEFYVSFTYPVKALTAVDDNPDGTSIFTVTPSVKGKYRWSGTRQLSFIPSEQLNPAQVYTITINDNLKNTDGVKIQGDKVFSTSTEPLRVIQSYPGTTMNKRYYYYSYSGLPLDKANNVVICMNHPLTEKEFTDNITIYSRDSDSSKKQRTYKATPVEDYYDSKEETAKYRKVEKSKLFYVNIEGSFAKNSSIIFSTRDVSDCHNYYLLRPFNYSYTNFNSYNSSIVINFNQPVDKKSVVSNITFTPSISYSENDVTVSGTSVIIRNLPTQYDTNYTVEISSNLKDKYGQILDRNKSANFKMPKAASYIKMLDTGNKILEAQYPHKFIIEHQNLLEGKYAISSVEDPISSSWLARGTYHTDNTKTLDVNLDNKRHFEEINLDPYLKNGLGFVRISAGGKTHSWSEWRGYYEDSVTWTNVVNIQVTNLGVTARIGYDKVVAFVRTLSDNKPVSGAKVYLYNNESGSNSKLDYSDCYAYGKTDANGYVEIDIPENEINSVVSAQASKNLALFVEKDKDKVTFIPDNHAPWRFSVYSTYLQTIYKKQNNLIFMFTDRGLYRPGETVSYRGIGRRLTKDGFSTLDGSFEVRLEKKSWNDDEVYATNSGYLSESGGFYGKFDLPKDLKPGSYTLGFYKDGNRIQYEEITVAYFEKVKFQASAKMPDVNYILGDSLTAELSASYLAGGSLTGASYDVSWYKQATDFIPSSPEAKNYVFGPIYSNHSASFVSQAKGKVSEDGTTRLSCNTAQDVLGQAYIYNAEIGVTDVSNQRIFTGASKIVHPGLFYIGAVRTLASGFPKANQKVEIPFALFKPDGSYAEASMVNDKIEYSISRSYWTCISEDSVDGLYSRWEEVTEVVDSGKVDAATKGNISFTPKLAGYYKLTLIAKDKKLNTVKTEKSFYVTGSGYSWYDSDNATSLRLSPDRNSYKPGETAQLLLESPLPKGDYLVTVERESIISSKVIHLESSCTTIDIPVEKSYLPLVYVSICSYSTRDKAPSHKYGEVDLDKPKGYYGVTPLFVDLDEVSFKIDIKSNKPTYRPGEEITLDLTATKDGKPLSDAELTLMVVDRAVVDIINYHVSNPLSYFYNEDNFPLGVVGGDSRQWLMDPVAYKVKTLQGGDALENSDTKEERKDFKPTAVFEPVIKTDSKGKATVTFKLPDSLTTYRVTVFGVKSNHFALKESEVQVQNPINVQQVQARRLRVRDTSEAGVIVTNLDTKDQKVTISASVRALKGNYASDTQKGLITVAGKAFIDGSDSKTVTVPAGKTMPVYFNVAAKAEGMVELVYEVKSDLLKERLISQLEIEKPHTFETVAVTGTVESSSPDVNEIISGKEKIIIPSWCKNGMGDLEITLDPSQIGLMGSSVKYVFDYPYGCLEQQSSRIWPLIIFADYIDTLGLKSKVSDPRNVVKKWLATVKKEQHSNGAFPYWPGSSYDSPYVSLRFLHMYKLGIDRGYSPADMGFDVEALKSYLVSEINKYKEPSVFKAYAAYVFSLYDDSRADSILDEAYNYIKNPNNKPSLSLVAYTALAYQNRSSRDAKKRAAELTVKIMSGAKLTGKSISFDSYRSSWDYWYGMYDNDSEAYATVMQLLVQQKSNDDIVNRLVYTLLLMQKAGYWQSTATTARVFEAFSVLIKERKLESLDFSASAIIADKTLLEGKFKGLGAKPEKKAFEFSGSELKNIKRNEPAEIEFVKNGKGTLYYTAQMRYAIPDELCAARDEGFEVILQIVDEDGNEVKPTSPDSKVIILEAGKVYNFNTTFITTHDRNFAAFRVPVPSGAEIVDSKLSTGASKNSSGDTAQYDYDYDDDDRYYERWYDWEDAYYNDSHEYFYDNEAQYFHNYMWAGETTHSLTVRASRKGVYPTPPVQAELMYEPEVFGRTEGYLFIVK